MGICKENQEWMKEKTVQGMLKKKLRLTSLDNSGKGVKWNYPEAADLSEDERTLAEVTTRANIAVWLVARGNKRYASREDLAGKDWI